MSKSVFLYFRSFSKDILASDSGSGTLLIQLGVLSLAEQYHTQDFLIWLKSTTLKMFISGLLSDRVVGSFSLFLDIYIVEDFLDNKY